MPDNSSLLPCPFCGGEAELTCGSTAAIIVVAGCANKECKMQPCVGCFDRSLTEAAWNTRAPSAERAYDACTIKFLQEEAQRTSAEIVSAQRERDEIGKFCKEQIDRAEAAEARLAEAARRFFDMDVGEILQRLRESYDVHEEMTDQDGENLRGKRR